MPRKRRITVPFHLGWVLSILVLISIVVLSIWFWDTAREFVLSNPWTAYAAIGIIAIGFYYGLVSWLKVRKKFLGA